MLFRPLVRALRWLFCNSLIFATDRLAAPPAKASTLRIGIGGVVCVRSAVIGTDSKSTALTRRRTVPRM